VPVARIAEALGLGIASNLVYEILRWVFLNAIAPGTRTERDVDGRPRTARPRAVWSYIVSAYVVLVFVLVHEHWLVPPSWAIAAVPSAFLFVSLLVVVVAVAPFRDRAKPVVAVLVAALSLGIADALAPKYVDIWCAGGSADEVVTGAVKEPRWALNVLVHPQSTQEWWVQQVPVADVDGRWRAHVVLGVRGKQYEIIAITRPTGTLFEEGRALRAVDIPMDAFRSRVCALTAQ